jgi:hypothetical protein
LSLISSMSFFFSLNFLLISLISLNI